MKKSLLLCLTVFLLLVVDSSCKTRKPTIEVRDQVKPSTKSPGQFVGNDRAFEWFDGKFNADINNNGKPNSVKGRVRIRKDSLIWIQIKPEVAIIEAFRILISPDSVQFVDYLNKKYFMDKFSAIEEFINYDVSFQMVQNIFMGNPTFIFDINSFKCFQNREGEDILASSDFKTYLDARHNKPPANYLFQALWFSNNLHKRNLMYDPANRMEMDLQYLEFESIDSIMFPKTTQLTVIGDSANTRFNFTYTKTELNSILEFPFSIPENYEPIFLVK